MYICTYIYICIYVCTYIHIYVYIDCIDKEKSNSPFRTVPVAQENQFNLYCPPRAFDS